MTRICLASSLSQRERGGGEGFSTPNILIFVCYQKPPCKGELGKKLSSVFLLKKNRFPPSPGMIGEGRE